MGDPDSIERPGVLLLSARHSTCAPPEILAYYWRGGHDFLYFDLKGGVVLHSDWWMAGE